MAKFDKKLCADRIGATSYMRAARGAVTEWKLAADAVIVSDRNLLGGAEVHRPQRLVCTLQDAASEMRAHGGSRRREGQISRIFEQAAVGIMEADASGRPRMVNKRFCEILGRTETDLQNSTFADYTHPDDIQATQEMLDLSVRTGQPFHLEKRYVRPDGEVVWCNVSVSLVANADGTIDRAVIVAEDITAKRNGEKAMRASEALHRSVLEASQDCIKILGADGRVKYINPAGVRAHELTTPGEVIGVDWVSLWPDAERNLAQASLEAAVQGEATRFSAGSRTASGTATWWDVLASPIRTDCGDVDGVLVIARDATDQRESAKQLKWASEHDALTELPNRRTFEAHLQATILRAMQTGGNVALLLLDLDHFKHVNDALGHAAGDRLLGVVSKRLQGCMREGDFVARLGGDEFAVIIEWEEGDFDLVASGRSILSQLKVPVRFRERMLTVSGRIGGAVFPQDARSAKELLANADSALHASKEAGGGGMKMFKQYMREQAQLVTSQLSLARNVISREDIVAHYQPKVLLKTGQIVGFEALLRWNHLRQGIQLPETISEAFKSYDLASQIGALMQSHVFADLRRWLDDGVSVGIVAINAAPAEFLRDDFAEGFLERLRQHDVPPSLIELEITEHVFLEQGSDYVARALQVLKAAGVSIALDDFGTGYSSLSHLRDYPVDVVKIDRSFVSEMTSDPEVRAIVSAVIQLTKSLGIKAIAEGVETRDQKMALIQDGCTLAQGFLFGRAAAGDEVRSILRRAEQSWRSLAC